MLHKAVSKAHTGSHSRMWAERLLKPWEGKPGAHGGRCRGWEDVMAGSCHPRAGMAEAMGNLTLD